jgi:3-methyladenine DNA glycosylase AlkD
MCRLHMALRGPSLGRAKALRYTNMSSAPIRRLSEELRSTLRAHADATKAGPMQAYMKSEMPYLGVQTPLLSAACREVFARHHLPTRSLWHTAVRTLWWDAQHREERYAAIVLTGRPEYDEFQRWTSLPLYEELVVSGAWWDLVDPIATQRLHVLLKRDRARMTSRMRSWARGRDTWLRRSAILCQTKMKGETDLDLLYDCIEPSIDSAEFFLRKAIGWALRERAKTDAREVLRYVRARRDRLSGLSKREALKAQLRNGSLAAVP